MKRVSHDAHLMGLWMFWLVVGEYAMAYARKGLRNLDVAITDARYAPFLVVATATIINMAKRIPLLAMTTYPFILTANFLCCIAEILNRTTLARRDRWMDKTVFKADAA